MLNTVRAVVRDGKIELLEPVALPDGTQVLICQQNGLDRRSRSAVHNAFFDINS